MRRTRVWRDGVLERQDFRCERISDYLAEPGTMVWLDLPEPTADDLALIAEEFGLNPLAVEDAVNPHQRPKLDRYQDHLFITVYAVDIGAGAEVRTSELALFVGSRYLITVRKNNDLSVDALLARWDESGDLAKHGVGWLLHGVFDLVVDGHFDAVQSLDDELDALEDLVFDDTAQGSAIQRRSFNVRKALVLLRRVTLPMREVVNSLLRREFDLVDETLAPYWQDVYDHVLRVSEWTDSLRDLVGSILETNLTIQGNRLNEIMKKLTSYAAIVAVPTAVTGFFGQNVPYPGFGTTAGFAGSVVVILLLATGLWLAFRRNGWL